MTHDTTHRDEHGTVEQHNGVDPGFPAVRQGDIASLCLNAIQVAREMRGAQGRIRLQDGRRAVEIEWSASEPAADPGPADRAALPAAAPDEPAGQAAAAPAVHQVTAPTVGTFYHRPEPAAPPCVSVGDVVRPGQPVGVLEVMKMTSPVEADAAGRVTGILVEDGAPVEFQQPLVLLEPLGPPPEGG